MDKLLHSAELFCRRNASTILTCVGGVGVIATSVMAVRTTPKAMRLLEEAEQKKGEKLTKLESVRVAGPAYIPSILVGASTIACIFSANMLNKRKQAALTSAYALLDSSYREYKTKFEELYGEEADARVKEEIAKDKYEGLKYLVDDDTELFFDELSGRYFNSTMENVLRAEYRLNRELDMRDYVYLNEFYEYLDIEPLDAGYTLGWSNGGNAAKYWQNWIDFGHAKVKLDETLECTLITMFTEPYPDFLEYN